jgi:hypothetical protein
MVIREMNTIIINKSKIAHWQQYSTCLAGQTITSIAFHELDEKNMKLIITLLEKMPKLLASLTKIEVSYCSFGKSTNERFIKLVKPSIQSIIFRNARFIDDGAVICSKLRKLHSIEISLLGVDMRNAQKSLCKLIMKGKATINLRLLHPNITQDYCSELFETMKSCSTLKSLELINIQYYVDNMMPALSENTSLTRLFLRGDDIGYSLADLEKAKPKTGLLELHLVEFFWADERSSTFFERMGEYCNLTKLVIGTIYFREETSGKLARSIQQLTSLKSLDISNTLFFNQHLRDALLSNTSITDLACTHSQFCAVMEECQRVNKSVNYKSLSFSESPIEGTDPLEFKQVLQLNGLTKIQLSSLNFNVDGFMEGLNSANCVVTNLEIISSLKERDVIKLSTGLENNSTLNRLSLKNNSLSDISMQFINNLIRGSKTIQYLSITEQKSLQSTQLLKELIEALKVNKTLLYLEMSLADRDLAVDLVANELTAANSTLLYFSPVSEDYRVDMWLQRNKQLHGVITVVLQNIIRTGSVLPLEIWVKIFSYLQPI